jgi:3-oxoacyl-[acyl-carrier-protein] synthase-3
VIYLHGLGHFHPENEITNRFLEELDIGTSHEWIMERVGIRSRRTTLPLDYIRETRNRDPRAAPEAAEYSNPELGARAARMAVERAGIDMADIGMVISGSSAADTATPAEACMVARELGLEVPAFDINSACTSFFTGLYTLSLMQPDRLPAFVLLVAPESLSRTVHYDDRASAVLWGDAGAAAVLSTQVPALARIIGNTLASSPEGADKIVVPRLGHFRQEGRVVQMFAIKRTSDLLDQRGLVRQHGRCELRLGALHALGEVGARRRRGHGRRRRRTELGQLPGPLRRGAAPVMTYAQFRSRSSFAKEELLAFAYGRLVKDPPEHFLARLPTPPMLMIDRVLQIDANGARGRMVAERDVNLDDWFFQCHFLGDPVQPGCLGLDGVWQLLGFYCNWRGGLGTGRALGCGEVDFFGQIRPHDSVIRYEVDVLRYSELPKTGASMVIGDARLLVDGDEIYKVGRARVGLFKDIDYPDYPLPSERSRGGKMER